MDSGSPLAECVPRILIGDRIAAVNRKAGDVTELLRHLKAEKLSMLVVRPGGLGAVEQNVKVDTADLEVEAAPEGSSSLAVTGGSVLQPGDRLIRVNAQVAPDGCASARTSH